MDWTEETISRLRGLWQEGLSTAEIGRRMSITKNAVVGKAHRLTLPARPSPIRKSLAAISPAPSEGARRAPVRLLRAVPTGDTARVAELLPRPVTQPPVTQPPGMPADGNGVVHQPRAGHEAVGTVTPLRAVEAATMQSPASVGAPVRAAPHDPDTDEPPVRHAPTVSLMSRGGDQATLRRRGQSCCWPLGDPGTKQFHFCGAEPIPNKPYCTEHAQLAYVKLRDRRETVA